MPRIRSGGGGGGTGGSSNSFETIDVPAGTDPVADSGTDTLTITETSPLVITGTAGTDTVDITWDTLTVTEGGIGAISLTDGGILLGSGTGAITPLGVATNGQIPIGDGATDPVLATITGTADEITVTNGAGTITLDIPDPLIVGKGGSGAATFTDGGILLGSGTGAFTALGAAANGQIPIGDGTTDPVLAGITGTANEVTVTDGAGSITLSLPNHAGTDISADLEEEVTEGSLADSTIISADIKDGTIAAADRADSAYHEWTLLPQGAVLDDGSPPALTVVESTGTGTPRFYVADFDAATDEIIYWSFDVPSDMAAGNWLLDVSWFANDIGASEDACFGAAISATTEGDADTMAEQAVSTIDYACEDTNATEVNRLVQTTITISDLDSVALGDTVTLAFRRDADNTNGAAGGDGLSSDARVRSARIRIPHA